MGGLNKPPSPGGPQTLLPLLCVTLLACGLALWSVPAGAVAQAEVAAAAAKRGDFAEAYCIWRPLAEAGDADAQYHLGWMYANGEGLARNPEKAVQWWRQAARQGHLEAQVKMGMALLSGDGVARDTEAALDWIEAAARQGDDDSQGLLRRLAADGEPSALARVRKLLVADWEVLGNAHRVVVDRGNVRNSPDLGARVVMVLSRGDEVVVLERKAPWVHIGVPGKGIIAWVHASLLD